MEHFSAPLRDFVEYACSPLRDFMEHACNPLRDFAEHCSSLLRMKLACVTASLTMDYFRLDL